MSTTLQHPYRHSCHLSLSVVRDRWSFITVDLLSLFVTIGPSSLFVTIDRPSPWVVRHRLSLSLLALRHHCHWPTIVVNSPLPSPSLSPLAFHCHLLLGVVTIIVRPHSSFVIWHHHHPPSAIVVLHPLPFAIRCHYHLSLVVRHHRHPSSIIHHYSVNVAVHDSAIQHPSPWIRHPLTSIRPFGLFIH